jgi:hypothetical protein
MNKTPISLREAMSLAFHWGQTYWSQADSESYAQNARAGETQEKFRLMSNEVSSRYETDIADLVAALRPFAQLASDVDRWKHPDNSTCAHRLTAGDIRRARDLLARIEAVK